MSNLPLNEPDPFDPGEAAVAVIGLTRILKGDMPKVGVMLQREILDLPRTIEKLANQFVNSQLPYRFKMPRDWTYNQLVNQFSQPLPESTIQLMIEQFPPELQDMALSFQLVVQNAYQHVANMIPVMDFDTYLGPKRIQPTSDKEWEFYNAYWLVSDPLLAFTLMQSGCLLPAQVKALQEFFPSLYENMKTALLMAIAKRQMGDAKFLMLPPRSDAGMRTFLGQKLIPYKSNSRVANDDRSRVLPPKQEPSKSLQTTGQKASEIT